MSSKHITDLDIQALVDGQVDEDASVRLMEIITGDPTLYKRYEAYRHQKKLLKLWWKDH